MHNKPDDCNAIKQELEHIMRLNGGVLLPEHIVEFARNPNTELHRHFEWDDTEAARQWRLEQARRLIRVHVTILPQYTRPVPCFVSLPSYRCNGGGYVKIQYALSRRDYRQEMLEDALTALAALEKRFHILEELEPVWRVVKRIRRQLTKQDNREVEIALRAAAL